MAQLRDIVPEYQDYLENGMTKEEIIAISKERLQVLREKEQTAQQQIVIEAPQPYGQAKASHDELTMYAVIIFPIVALVVIGLLYKVLKRKNNDLTVLSFLKYLLLGALYILIFIILASVFAKLQNIDFAFYIGGNIFILFAAYVQYTLKDFIRSVAVILFFAFGSTTGTTEFQDSSPVEYFIVYFIEAFLLINITTALFSFVKKIFSTIETTVSAHEKKLVLLKLVGLVKYLFIFSYFVLGVCMVLFPPGFYKAGYGQQKFNFILNTDKIDIYFFAYEVVSYMLIGFLTYFIYTKLACQKKEKN